MVNFLMSVLAEACTYNFNVEILEMRRLSGGHDRNWGNSIFQTMESSNGGRIPDYNCNRKAEKSGAVDGSPTQAQICSKICDTLLSPQPPPYKHFSHFPESHHESSPPFIICHLSFMLCSPFSALTEFPRFINTIPSLPFIFMPSLLLCSPTSLGPEPVLFLWYIWVGSPLGHNGQLCT